MGFHVYLMPWFAALRLNVDGNEDWHVENRLCYSSPPKVQQATLFLSFCPCICHYKLTTLLPRLQLYAFKMVRVRACTQVCVRALYFLSMAASLLALRIQYPAA